MRKITLSVCFTIFFIFLLGCSSTNVDAVATYTFQTLDAQESIEKSLETEVAVGIMETTIALDPDAFATVTPTKGPLPTLVPWPTPIPDPLRNRRINMEILIAEMYITGKVDSLEGKYIHIDDIKKSLSKIDYYNWEHSGYSPIDFVVRVDVKWDSAYEKANINASGCGFVFRASETEHYLGLLALDGNVYFGRNQNGSLAHWLNQSYYKQVGFPSGGAELMLVVQGTHFDFYVDQIKVVTGQHHMLTEGALGFTVLSGTNKDWGTKCEFINIDLWIMVDGIPEESNTSG